MNSKWTNFLGSLATSGGNLFLLATFSLIMMFTTIFLMIKFGPATPVVITIVGTYSAFTGAMIGILRGSHSTDPAPLSTTVDQTQTTVTKTIPSPEEIK